MVALKEREVQWHDNGALQRARWLSEPQYPPPTRIVLIDDQTSADEAYRLATQGISLLWRGDYHNARQLLQAMGRRIDKSVARAANRRAKKTSAQATSSASPADATLPSHFHQQRQQTAQRARLLSRVLIPFEADYNCRLRRAPDLRAACLAAFGPMAAPCVLSLRDVQGALGAAGWRDQGVAIDALGLRIYPHYGVFAPTRHEYLPLLLEAPLPAVCDVAYDIGTGTGLLAIALAQRGIDRVIATDLNPRAIACAQDNVARLGLDNIQLQQCDLYPSQAAPANLIVCNPPWLPAKPSAPLEYAVYDPDSTMLRHLLQGACQQLTAQGELWLILSDLAEHLGLRTHEELLGWFADSGLTVKYRLDTTPKHGRSHDESDPLYAARSSEVISLWCLI